ncbi:MAG: GTPase HflX [Firmicutes bacterium]|nr:GTPase HflX [Bacillota bacterium]
MPERGYQAIDLLPENKEKALLVGSDLEELCQLVEAAGGVIAGQVRFKGQHLDRVLYVGKGKALEIKGLKEETNANLVVIDGELTPAQVRNLEELLECRVLDRSNIILDIFAQRAKTREGKLQVELAQLKYLLPRLTGIGTALSRLGGGIGTRGPGETKLETDRRHLRQRIGVLEKELKSVQRRRQLQRLGRSDLGLPLIALVGYTNAGKSTLMNRLSSAGVLEENQVFSTLDPVSRLIALPENRSALLSDTVGFIRRLPHQLIAAFRATLEEVKEADLLLHVVDASSPDMEEQQQAVIQVLKEIEADQIRTITVFNKMDRLWQDKQDWFWFSQTPDSVTVSALTGKGIEQLLQLINLCLSRPGNRFLLLLPFAELSVLAKIREYGQVISTEYQEEGVMVDAWVEPPIMGAVHQYIVKRLPENGGSNINVYDSKEFPEKGL